MVRVISATSVSVVIPCRNERGYIAECLNSIFAQDLSGIEEFEVVVADGCSDDGTRDVLEKYKADESRLVVLDNPGRIVSTGLNCAVRIARGEVIIRMDAHTEYAPDYVRRCVQVLKETGASCVGGPWRATGKGYVGTAIAAAFQSPFAVGGARGHALHYEGPVDTVYLGCWLRSDLLELGLFDEEMVRNQDDELSLRVICQGGKIWQSPSIRSLYSVRGTLGGLFRQYLQYGYWKVAVIRKHRRPAAIRHLAPVALLLWLVLAWVPALAWAPLLVGYLVPIGIYAAMIMTGSLLCSFRAGWRFLPVFPIILTTFHLAYGIGFSLGIFDAFVRREKRASMKKLTRSSPEKNDRHDK